MGVLNLMACPQSPGPWFTQGMTGCSQYPGCLARQPGHKFGTAVAIGSAGYDRQ